MLRLKKKDSQRVILKFLEFIALGGILYYVTVKAGEINPIILIAAYITLFILWLIPFWGQYNRIENIDLLIKLFYDMQDFRKEDDVQITIHKRIDEKHYKQYTNHYPHGKDKGNIYPTEKGIVYYAFKECREFSENFESSEDKEKKLLERYNYRMDEIRERLHDKKVSYYCAPIIKDDKVWGVIYMRALTVFIFPRQEELEGSIFSDNVQALIKMIEDEIN